MDIFTKNKNEKLNYETEIVKNNVVTTTYMENVVRYVKKMKDSVISDVYKETDRFKSSFKKKPYLTTAALIAQLGMFAYHMNTALSVKDTSQSSSGSIPTAMSASPLSDYKVLPEPSQLDLIRDNGIPTAMSASPLSGSVVLPDSRQSDLIPDKRIPTAMSASPLSVKLLPFKCIGTDPVSCSGQEKWYNAVINQNQSYSLTPNLPDPKTDAIDMCQIKPEMCATITSGKYGNRKRYRCA
jgi:hypothetical protein